MSNTKTILLQYGVLIEVPAENTKMALEVEDDIRDQIRAGIKAAVGQQPEHFGLCSERYLRIDNLVETGQCAVCGVWVTNADPPSVLDGLEQGMKIDGQWRCCEEHLPSEYYTQE